MYVSEISMHGKSLLEKSLLKMRDWCGQARDVHYRRLPYGRFCGCARMRGCSCVRVGAPEHLAQALRRPFSTNGNGFRCKRGFYFFANRLCVRLTDSTLDRSSINGTEKGARNHIESITTIAAAKRPSRRQDFLAFLGARITLAADLKTLSEINLPFSSSICIRGVSRTFNYHLSQSHVPLSLTFCCVSYLFSAATIYKILQICLFFYRFNGRTGTFMNF